MTETAQLLADSRTAHQQATGAHRAGNRPNAVDLFAVALAKRLAAREADPKRRDPAWLEDAKAPPRRDEKGRTIANQYHRMPGLTRAEVAAKADADLELFYRTMTGELPNPVSEVSSQLEDRILVPETWEVRQSGVTPCADCGHREDDHVDVDSIDPLPTDSADARCDVEGCGCPGYQAAICKHAFEPLADKQRRCATCGEIQQSVPKMAIEDTEAFKQLQNERKR